MLVCLDSPKGSKFVDVVDNITDIYFEDNKAIKGAFGSEARLLVEDQPSALPSSDAYTAANYPGTWKGAVNHEAVWQGSAIAQKRSATDSKQYYMLRTIRATWLDASLRWEELKCHAAPASGDRRAGSIDEPTGSAAGVLD